jgi:hypothetical protein
MTHGRRTREAEATAKREKMRSKKKSRIKRMRYCDLGT